MRLSTLYASPATYSASRKGQKIEFIVIHYTGGMAGAYNNCKYFSGGNREASAHYFLDGSGTVWQSVPDTGAAWAVGNMDLNRRSISIEVVSAGRDFTEAEIRELGELVKRLQKKYGIDDDHVVRHYDMAKYRRTGSIIDPYKHCPAPYVNDAKWRTLKSKVLDGKETTTMSKQTISQWLGCTREPVEWLKSHESDDYYLGTPYKGLTYYGSAMAKDFPFLTCYPKGEVKQPYMLTEKWIKSYEPGMNCAGFIAHVMTLCKGDAIHKITGNYRYVNAGNWYRAVKENDLLYYTFSSKAELLASKQVHKGDILVFMPKPGAKSDGHIVFYWGDDQNRDLMWGSGSPNHITPITDYAPEPFEYMIIPTWLKPIEVTTTPDKPADKPAEDPAPDRLYRVQVGAYASKENAEAMVRELAAKGYPAIIK